MIKAIYIHIPYCALKCHYCDFLSFGREDEAHMKRYIDYLCREIKLAKEKYAFNEADTVYIGGGTPSILPYEALKALFMTIEREILAPGKIAEYTFEANPESLSAEKIELLAAFGVNRLSLGVQSSDDEYLKLLGRGHNFKQAEEAIKLLRRKGLRNISIDLMYALPQESLQHWQETLKRAVDLAPEHLSAYQLQIEEGTYLAKLQKEGRIVPADEDTAAEMLFFSSEYLPENGYERYELSNYAKTGFRSQHNSHYWHLDDYLGLGLGATSLVDGEHLVRPRKIKDYYQALDDGLLPVGARETLSLREQMEEYILMNLRLKEGLSLRDFAARFGCSFSQTYAQAIAKTAGLALSETDGEYFRLTEKGKFLANVVMLEFLN